MRRHLFQLFLHIIGRHLTGSSKTPIDEGYVTYRVFIKYCVFFNEGYVTYIYEQKGEREGQKWCVELIMERLVIEMFTTLKNILSRRGNHNAYPTDLGLR